MKLSALQVFLVSVSMIWHSSSSEVDFSDSESYSFFLIAVPDSKLTSFRQSRQEEAAGGVVDSLANAAGQGTANYIGIILNGVLGGDVRGIFAGSTAFIPEGNVRDGISDILQKGIAPALNRIFKDIHQSVFNATTTTPKPAQPLTLNQVQQKQLQQQSQNLQQNPYLQRQVIILNQNKQAYQQRLQELQKASQYLQIQQQLAQQQAEAEVASPPPPQRENLPFEPVKVPISNFVQDDNQQIRVDPLQPNYSYQRSDLNQSLPETAK